MSVVTVTILSQGQQMDLAYEILSLDIIKEINHKDYFAVDVKHLYRLIFRPANEPLPKLKDGGIDLKGVTQIEIITDISPSIFQFKASHRPL